MLKGFVSITHFEGQSFPKYTKAARGLDGVEVMRMIDLVLLKKDMLRYVRM